MRLRFYHPDVWRDPSYRTRDGTIPFALFLWVERSLASTLAYDRLQQAHGVASAIALSFGKADGGLPASVTSDLRDAHLLPPG